MGRGKLENVLIEDRNKRKDCFSKRNKGILKKLYELAYISGCGVHLVVEAENGNVYEFHRRMSPAIQNSISSAASNCKGKPTNRRMFFNGVRIMDTGQVVSPAERSALLDPNNCPCFDCQKGYSSRLCDAISRDDGRSGHSRLLINKASFMDQPAPLMLASHPQQQYAGHEEVALPPLLYTDSDITITPPQLTTQGLGASDFTNLPPPPQFTTQDGDGLYEDQKPCLPELSQRIAMEEAMVDTMAPIVELPNIDFDNFYTNYDLPNDTPSLSQGSAQGTGFDTEELTPFSDDSIKNDCYYGGLQCFEDLPPHVFSSLQQFMDHDSTTFHQQADGNQGFAHTATAAGFLQAD